MMHCPQFFLILWQGFQGNQCRWLLILISRRDRYLCHIVDTSLLQMSQKHPHIAIQPFLCLHQTFASCQPDCRIQLTHIFHYLTTVRIRRIHLVPYTFITIFLCHSNSLLGIKFLLFALCKQHQTYGFTIDLMPLTKHFTRNLSTFYAT